LAVINSSNFASIPFEGTVSDKDFLSSERIKCPFVHISNSCSSTLFLGHVLISKNFDISYFFYENSIGLVECSIPQEDYLLLDELNHTFSALVDT
jgi:hypothetical protein